MTVAKLMYAAWGDGLPARLHDPALHERLASVGVRRLQLNLDDPDVAPAMRIPTGDPITGFVSVWAEDGTEAPVNAVLGSAVDRLAGWWVEERLPIEPPPSGSGERVDALANVAVLRRPEGLSRAEWLHRWLVDHTPVAIATQATFGYVQNVVLGPATDETPPRVGALVEELFPSAAMTDMHAFYGSGGDDAELQDRLNRLMASVARFGADHDLDLVPTSRYVYELA